VVSVREAAGIEDDPQLTSRVAEAIRAAIARTPPPGA
jgi:hypothetical protein